MLFFRGLLCGLAISAGLYALLAIGTYAWLVS